MDVLINSNKVKASYNKWWNTQTEGVDDFCGYYCVECECGERWVVLGVGYIWITAREIHLPNGKHLCPPIINKHNLLQMVQIVGPTMVSGPKFIII